MSYPEHDRLSAVADKSQCVGEFLEWLQEQGITLCAWSDEERMYFGAAESTASMLSRFFEVDLHRLESEKRAMLDEQRKLNGR